MRIAVLSYPMLFQTTGGLSMKVGRTVKALQARGLEARLFDPVHDRLRDFDLVHVFAAFNGNQRVVQQAKEWGVPVVLSTILSPPFSRFDGVRARLLSRLVGRLSGWNISTSHQQIADALTGADHLVALGETERRMLVDGYGVPAEKVSVVHNGIGEEFFNADPELFQSRYGIDSPFVLHTGMVYDVKNQLGLVRALKGTGVPIVLVGHSGAATAEYLSACLQEGGADVRHLGELPHGELVASAYAACKVVAIPSRYEGMPNSVLEGLASDRPVVLTNNHSIDFPLPRRVAAEVDPDDLTSIRDKVLELWNRPPVPGSARAVVAHLSWDAVAERLAAIYVKVMAKD